MRTAAQRDAKYRARMQSTQIDPTLTAMHALQAVNFTTYEMAFYPKQVACRDLLNVLGVTTTEFFLYEAYNGELYHLTRSATGAAAIAEKEVLVAKYVSLGLDAPTLQSIALTVWEIPEPSTP